MIIMASGIGRGRVIPDDDDGSDGVTQDGGHTTNNKSTGTCSLKDIRAKFF